MIDEFMRWLSGEKEICTSPVAARMSAAAGEAGTLSVRNGSQPFDVPPLPAELADGLPTGLGPIRPV
jgi:hypothetical protein